MITTRASVDTARATATICCTPSAELAERPPDVDRDAVAGEQLARRRGACVAKSISRSRLQRLPAEEQVARDAHLRDEVQLLVDGADPGGLRVARRAEADRLAPVPDDAAVRPVHDR